MREPLTAPAYAYAPDASRVASRAPAEPPEWLIRWIVLLIFFLREPRNAIRLLRSGAMRSAWWEQRPDLPPGSAQAHFAAVRGAFGNSIRWMCIRHGIGPGHPDWPELSRAIVAFGSTIDGFWEGAPPRGLHWWENPGVIPGMGPHAETPATTSAAVRQIRAIANAAPRVPSAPQAEPTHVRFLASQSRAPRVAASLPPDSWLPASLRQVFARAGPAPSTGPPGCPGLRYSVTTYERGQSMAGPAVLIRADRQSRARPRTAHANRCQTALAA